MQALMQHRMLVMHTAAMQPVLRGCQLLLHPQMVQQQQKVSQMLRKGLSTRRSAPSLQRRPHNRLRPCVHGLLQLMPRALQQREQQRIAWLLSWTAAAFTAAQQMR
jgi:hypothetical protein